MIVALALRSCSVVTAGTCADDRSVVDPCHRTPAVGDVTVFTGVGDGDVTVIFPSRFFAVVATDAVSVDTVMIEINIRLTYRPRRIARSLQNDCLVCPLPLFRCDRWNSFH